MLNTGLKRKSIKKHHYERKINFKSFDKIPTLVTLSKRGYAVELFALILYIDEEQPQRALSFVYVQINSCIS